MTACTVPSQLTVTGAFGQECPPLSAGRTTAQGPGSPLPGLSPGGPLSGVSSPPVPRLTSRDVVVDVEEVLGVKAPLHVDKLLVLRRSEDRAGVDRAVPRQLLTLEVDVLASGARGSMSVDTPRTDLLRYLAVRRSCL